MSIASSTQTLVLPAPGAAVLPGPDGGAGGERGVVMTPATVVAAGVLLALFGGLFHHWLYVQNFLSWNVADWTHAYFVPAISVYLLWQKRRDLSVTPARLFWPGLLPMLVGINAYLFFQVGAVVNHMAQGWSLILTLFGLLLFVGGPRLMRVLFLPLAYMVFAVAVSDPIMRGLTFRMQLMASEGAWVLLNIVGVQCDLEGNVLKVTTSKFGIVPLNVAEACAGMRMVIGFVALGAAVALVATNLWWKRIGLFLLALPVAVFMNMVRVAILSILTMVNPDLAAGQSHMFMGTLVLIAGFFVYMGVVWVLNKAVPEEETKTGDVRATAFWSGRGGWSARVFRRPGFVVPAVVLAVSALVVPVGVWAMGIHLRKQAINAPGGRTMNAVPVETPSWVRIGKDVQESAEMIEELGTTNYLTRTYLSKSAAKDKARAIDVHLAYYTGMIDTIPHVPERCLVGGGWQITGATRVVPLTVDQSTWRPELGPGSDPTKLVYGLTDRSYSDLGDAVKVRLPKMPNGLSIRVTEFTNPKSGTHLFAGYLFIANGTATDSADNVRLLAFDLRDDYAYYLKVQFASQSARTVEEFGTDASSILGDLLPEIMRCVPDWSAVEAGTYPPDNPRSKKAKAAGTGPG